MQFVLIFHSNAFTLVSEISDVTSIPWILLAVKEPVLSDASVELLSWDLWFSIGHAPFHWEARALLDAKKADWGLRESVTSSHPSSCSIRSIIFLKLSHTSLSWVVFSKEPVFFEAIVSNDQTLVEVWVDLDESVVLFFIALAEFNLRSCTLRVCCSSSATTATTARTAAATSTCHSFALKKSTFKENTWVVISLIKHDKNHIWNEVIAIQSINVDWGSLVDDCAKMRDGHVWSGNFSTFNQSKKRLAYIFIRNTDIQTILGTTLQNVSNRSDIVASNCAIWSRKTRHGRHLNNIRHIGIENQVSVCSGWCWFKINCNTNFWPWSTYDCCIRPVPISQLALLALVI